MSESFSFERSYECDRWRPVAPTPGNVFHAHTDPVGVAGLSDACRNLASFLRLVGLAACPAGLDFVEAVTCRRRCGDTFGRDLCQAPFAGGKSRRSLVG